MSNNNNELGRQPLMYIVQPEYQKIDPDMQSVVIKKKKQKKSADTKSQETEKEAAAVVKEAVVAAAEPEAAALPVPEEAVEAAEAGSFAAEQENRNEDKVLADAETERRERISKRKGERNRKPLHTMSVLEKIDFFAKLPVNMPRTLCQIETESEILRGIILSEENGEVTIRNVKSSQQEVLKAEEIKAINLLGF
ncbi:hypothetical protein GJU40_16355 [Bacillus lacus]|uniref:Spore coat protein CotO n=1 Tax=Metabacillus lacus TaxID=1983721 RepID=A0A7X2M153_9BACI|nr:CotO family spore coat protein [Metabacillus lacus]MRX73714.1 hypothetical protein [Metabacillus lacus]